MSDTKKNHFPPVSEWSIQSYPPLQKSVPIMDTIKMNPPSEKRGFAQWPETRNPFCRAYISPASTVTFSTAMGSEWWSSLARRQFRVREWWWMGATQSPGLPRNRGDEWHKREPFSSSFWMEYTTVSTTSEIGAHYGHHKNETTLRKKGFRAMTWNPKPLLPSIHFARFHGDIQHRNGFRMVIQFGSSATSSQRMMIDGGHSITRFIMK